MNKPGGKSQQFLRWSHRPRSFSGLKWAVTRIPWSLPDNARGMMTTIETKARPKFLEYVMTLGMTTMEGRGFYYPVDIAIGQDERLYVVNRSLDIVPRGIRVTMCDIDSEY